MTAGGAARRASNTMIFRYQVGAEEIRFVLAYEAFIRNKSNSKTAFEMVMGAVDRETYPAEVLSRLDELRADIDRRAAEAALAGKEGGEDG